MSENPMLDIVEHAGDGPISASTGISALAMNFALKWHDMRIIKDGTLYQQKKMEGANIQIIDLPDVLQTAMQFEAYLLSGPERHAKILKEDIMKRLVGCMTDMVIDAMGDVQEKFDEQAD